jgi:tetratricopeptide (TPR) repeat protein
MNPLGEQVLLVAKQYLGPAAQQFLSKELRTLECTADTITPWHLPALSERARISGARIMDAERAVEFGDRIAGLVVAAEQAPVIQAVTRARENGGTPRLALDAAAKLFTTGKLRQAEEAYRQLAQKHGDAESCRGLAKTQVALEDVASALLTLRDGAAGLARNGDRTAAIGLLTDAVGMAPGDLAAHRRLAAAHANAGDQVAACAEYERFVDYALAEGDSRRAWLELTYARETLGDLPGLVRIVDRLMPGAAQSLPPVRHDAPIARAVTQQVSPPPPQPPEVRRIVPAEPPAPQRIVIDDLPRTRPVGAPSNAMVMADARTMTSVDAFDEAPVDLAARIAPRSKDAVRKAEQAAWKARPAMDLEKTLGGLVPAGSLDQQAAITAMRATVLIGARDPRATEAAIDAARRLLSLHKLQAASDLLLDFIAAGYTDREAQRLLIEVDCGLGQRDVARAKCRLLGEAYRLDGRVDTASDVERLAAII